MPAPSSPPRSPVFPSTVLACVPGLFGVGWGYRYSRKKSTWEVVYPGGCVRRIEYHKFILAVSIWRLLGRRRRRRRRGKSTCTRVIVFCNATPFFSMGSVIWIRGGWHHDFLKFWAVASRDVRIYQGILVILG